MRAGAEGIVIPRSFLWPNAGVTMLKVFPDTRSLRSLLRDDNRINILSSAHAVRVSGDAVQFLRPISAQGYPKYLMTIGDRHLTVLVTHAAQRRKRSCCDSPGNEKGGPEHQGRLSHVRSAVTAYAASQSSPPAQARSSTIHHHHSTRNSALLSRATTTRRCSMRQTRKAPSAYIHAP
ncbi:MAG: hypothetical protein JWM95_2127 [Gemmatimonadetes bacterium]|nr:hypothetical protein [Gemmatimonadota bacterium]